MQTPDMYHREENGLVLGHNAERKAALSTESGKFVERSIHKPRIRVKWVNENPQNPL